jgi:hypothetical protein
MLGLLDFLRAVKGTLTLAFRRVHPLAGAAVVAVVWMGALGAMYTMSTDDSSSLADSLAGADEGTTGDDWRSSTTVGDDDWSSSSTSSEEPGAPRSVDGDDHDEAATTTDGTGPDGDLGAPGSSTPASPPRTSTPRPSWADPTTSTTTSTTEAPGASSTTTTTEPSSGGGILGGLADLLGLGG